jgi:hypothetical protein
MAVEWAVCWAEPKDAWMAGRKAVEWAVCWAAPLDESLAVSKAADWVAQKAGPMAEMRDPQPVGQMALP